MFFPQQLDPKIFRQQGFTLLEVMISITIAALSLSILYATQIQSLKLIEEAEFNTTAALLAQQKTAQYEAGMTNIFITRGGFTQEYSDYRWELKLNSMEHKEFDSLGALSPFLHQRTITITAKGTNYSYSLTTYTFRPDSEKNTP